MIKSQIKSHFDRESPYTTYQYTTQDDSDDKASLVYIGDKGYNYN